MDYNIGKGVYIWQPGTIEDGDPDRLLARMQMAGVQAVSFKLCEAAVVYKNLHPLIQKMRDNHIHVSGWGYSYLNKFPVQEAHAVINACEMYEPDFYLIDVEAEVEGNYAGARMFMNELRPALSGLPLGLNTFWNVNLHPDFPWQVFLEGVDFVCPQMYWRGTDPIGKLTQCQQSYADVANARPMPLIAGDLYTHLGVKPTPDQVTQWLTAVDKDPFIQGVYMWAADDTQTTPELWQAFSKYQWKEDGAIIPTQPIGWGKIKAGGGLYIRSAPSGDKLGSLAKDELTPIWGVTETKWAAINKSQDQWIYAGNPSYVDVVMDTSNVPPLPLGLYKAKVTARTGLNVRDNPNGKKLSVLALGTIVQAYEEKNGFARIDANKSQWVSLQYLSKMS